MKIFLTNIIKKQLYITGNIHSYFFSLLKVIFSSQKQAMRKREIPEYVKIVGSNIKRIIQEKNLKVRHVAHDADLDIEALRRYMAGKQIMGIDKIVYIAKALKIEDYNELFKDV